jgi:hypothetical protein
MGCLLNKAVMIRPGENTLFGLGVIDAMPGIAPARATVGPIEDRSAPNATASLKSWVTIGMSGSRCRPDCPRAASGSARSNPHRRGLFLHRHGKGAGSTVFRAFRCLKPCATSIIAAMPYRIVHCAVANFVALHFGTNAGVVEMRRVMVWSFKAGSDPSSRPATLLLSSHG